MATLNLNGRKASTPSQLVDEGDKITVKDRKSSQTIVHDAIEANHREIPGWLMLDEKAQCRHGGTDA
jgi:ribosomal protein S4